MCEIDGRRALRLGMGVAIAALGFVTPVHAGAPRPFAPPPDAERVLYRDATLVDVAQGVARPHMNVLVAGERILGVYADTAPAPEAAATARVVDLHGQYLMPGLVDSHVHLATPPNRRQAEAVLRRDLYGGVTTVRDMADDLRPVGDMARASLVGEIAAPDILFAALMAGPDFFDDPRTIEASAGGVPGQLPWMQAIAADTDLPLAVARAAGTWATAIKLYADLDAATAARITAEAHRQHLLVWAHATLYPAKPSEVVDAGVDVISHACLLVRESAGPAPGLKQPRPRVNLAPFRAGNSPLLAPLFAKMVARGTILDATVWTYAPSAAGAPPPGPASAAPLTPSLAPGSCDDVVGGAITAQAWRAGVQVSAGTDNVAPAAEPWPELFHELAALSARAGIPPAGLLRSATLVGARAAGRERDIGSIEPGKLADMVVLRQDPLTDVEHLKSVVMTIKRGRVFARGDFVPLQDADIIDVD